MTGQASPARNGIVERLIEALEPSESVRALWMMGSVAFNRLDQLSDIDLVLDVRPEHMDETWGAIESALESLAPLDYAYEVAQPAWHGHEQRFYHLDSTPQHLMVDVVMMASGQGLRFDEVERHGTPVVLFDKDGIVTTAHVDPKQIRTILRARLDSIESLLPLAYSLVAREIARGRSLDAFGFYQRFVVDNLVTLARMKHDPHRHDFGLRYLDFDLPRNLRGRIEACCYVTDLEQLASRFDEARSLIAELLGYLNRELA